MALSETFSRLIAVLCDRQKTLARTGATGSCQTILRDAVQRYEETRKEKPIDGTGDFVADLSADLHRLQNRKFWEKLVPAAEFEPATPRLQHYFYFNKIRNLCWVAGVISIESHTRTTANRYFLSSTYSVTVALETFQEGGSDCFRMCCF
ncbi:hypothetical protein [Roseibium sp.]|uniref:hypothetical protein n=1 Tax=Roseibium sp. TaxID=1936156 RepID=UPI003BA847BC